ncbi:hypothetical protein B296_00048740, partial [Ensete ventricosum]
MLTIGILLTGHAMWPAVVVSESNFGPRGDLKPTRINQSILVQFFGTHDFARFDPFSRDPCSVMSYKVQVLRNPKVKARPLFRVTTDDGEQELPNSRVCSKYFESYGDMPMGYRAVRVDWKDLDRCGVCDMDEEYEDNLFLQCDKCRIMVHAKCYGELEPLDGVLWLCNLCRPGAPNILVVHSVLFLNLSNILEQFLMIGKSKIHGFGVFAKLAHKAGDMVSIKGSVIEYIGELVRPTIADIRERRIYNSLV